MKIKYERNEAFLDVKMIQPVIALDSQCTVAILNILSLGYYEMQQRLSKHF